MTFWDWVKLTLLTIITFGFIWIFIKRKHQNSDKLSRTEKLPFKITKLLLLIGGKDNVEKISATHTKIKINIKLIKLVNVAEIRKLKSVSGTFISSNSITIIVGNSAKSIQEAVSNI